MSVNGYFDLNYFQSSYAYQRITPVQPGQENKPLEEAKEPAKEMTAGLELQSTTPVTRTQMPLEDVRLAFSLRSPEDYIGQSFEQNAEDLQKAVSSVQKDEILQDYEFFVGDFSLEVEEQQQSQPIFTPFASEDGMVFLK